MAAHGWPRPACPSADGEGQPIDRPPPMNPNTFIRSLATQHNITHQTTSHTTQHHTTLTSRRKRARRDKRAANKSLMRIYGHRRSTEIALHYLSPLSLPSRSHLVPLLTRHNQRPGHAGHWLMGPHRRLRPRGVAAWSQLAINMLSLFAPLLSRFERVLDKTTSNHLTLPHTTSTTSHHHHRPE